MLGNNMKVLALTSSFPYHDKDERSVFIKRLYDALSQTGIDLTVVAPNPYIGELCYQFESLRGEYPAFGKSGLARTVLKNPLSILSLPGAIREFQAIIARHRPDVVHANWTLCGVAAATSGYRSLVTLRGSDVHMMKPAPLRIATRLLLHRTVAFTAVGAALAHLGSQALARSVVVIENGTELATPESISVPPSYVVAVSNVIPSKNLLRLVRVFARIAQCNAAICLLIAGRLSDEGYSNAVRAEIERFGLAGRVRLLGAVSPGQITALLNDASAFCSMSSSEGRPNAVLEAQLAGLPCILSDIPGHRELVTSNDRLISGEEEIGGWVNEFISQPRRTPTCIGSWKSCALRYKALYESVVESGISE